MSRVRGIHKLALGGAGAAMLATAVAAHYEGLRLHAYADVGGVPTICYGRTQGVYPGMTATQAECKAWLTQEMARAITGVRRCAKRQLTPSQAAALGDWAYNAGVSAACRSTLMRQLNSGYPPSVWCRQLLRWTRANGVVLPGLVARRHAEYELCISK